MSKVQCYSYFRIYSQIQLTDKGEIQLPATAVANGNFDPDTITALLGIQPHRAWRDGDTNRHGRVYRFSDWSACLQTEPTLDAGQQCLQIVRQLHEKIDLLNSLRQQYRLVFSINIVPTMNARDSTPALYFGQEVIDFCHRTGTEIDVDMYIGEASTDSP